MDISRPMFISLMAAVGDSHVLAEVEEVNAEFVTGFLDTLPGIVERDAWDELSIYEEH